MINGLYFRGTFSYENAWMAYVFLCLEFILWTTNHVFQSCSMFSHWLGYYICIVFIILASSQLNTFNDTTCAWHYSQPPDFVSVTFSWSAYQVPPSLLLQPVSHSLHRFSNGLGRLRKHPRGSFPILSNSPTRLFSAKLRRREAWEPPHRASSGIKLFFHACLLAVSNNFNSLSLLCECISMSLFAVFVKMSVGSGSGQWEDRWGRWWSGFVLSLGFHQTSSIFLSDESDSKGANGKNKNWQVQNASEYAFACPFVS